MNVWFQMITSKQVGSPEYLTLYDEVRDPARYMTFYAEHCRVFDVEPSLGWPAPDFIALVVNGFTHASRLHIQEWIAANFDVGIIPNPCLEWVDSTDYEQGVQRSAVFDKERPPPQGQDYYIFDFEELDDNQDLVSRCC